MKILFIGSSLGVDRIVGPLLRQRGHTVDSVGPDSDRPELRLSKRDGFLGSSRYLYDIMKTLPAMRGYDAVQLGSHLFLEVGPGRLSYFVKELKKTNRALFLSALRPDFFYTEACVRKGLFRFSPYRIGTEKSVLAKCNPEAEYEDMENGIRDYERFLLSQLSGVMTFSPEMEIALRPVAEGIIRSVPFPVPVPDNMPEEMSGDGRISLIVPGNRLTDLREGRDGLRRMAREIVETLPEDCVLLENIDKNHRLQKDAIWLDSVCRYSPSPDALSAMACGAIAVSGCQPEYADFVNTSDIPPVICGAPGKEEEIKSRLISLIEHRDNLVTLSGSVRDFVRKYHSPEAVASALECLWERM